MINLANPYKLKDKLLNLEYLQSKASSIYLFGLGFVQIKLGSTQNLNFYDPNLTPCFVTGEHIHTHPYNFRSTILSGSLQETTYHYFTDEKTPIHPSAKLIEVDCKGNFVNPTENFYLQSSNHFIHKEGDTYYRNFNEFHEVSPALSGVGRSCITLVKKTYCNSHKAYAIVPKDFKQCSPFIADTSIRECWDIVAEILKNAK